MIGAGGIARQHAQCYRRIPEAKIVAVADVEPERAESIAAMFGAEALDHGDKIFERDDLDMVDVCLPTYLHCEYVLKAAAKKLHTLCEKPIALNVAEGLRMKEATEKAGVKFMVAQVLRYFPEYAAAKKMMDDGRIGKPVMARTYRGGVHPGRVREWYADIDKCGGAIQDTLIHDIDYLRYCFGPVKDVFVKGNTFKRTPYLEYDLVNMEFQNGVMAHMIVDWSQPENGNFSTKLELIGTEGSAEFNSNDSVPLTALLAKTSSKDGVAIPESPLTPRSNPYAREIIDFIRCVEDDTEPPIGAADALEALNVVMAALESERENKPVAVKGVF
jgi:predicted dehydrogenase